MGRLFLSAPTLGVAVAALVLGGCGGEEIDESPGDAPTPDAEAATPLSEMPDVVVILIDTLRSDHLATYGYDAETAPYLSALANESVVFDRAYSTSSWTAPSTASLFTGLYPPRHGVTVGFRAQSKTAEVEDETELMDLVTMPTSLPTLPQLFQAAGYTTFGISSNINISDPLGFTRGFDHFSHQHDDAATQLTYTVLEWKDEMQGEAPNFLYLHFNDVHKPYNKREPWYSELPEREQATVARYDSEIAYLDTEIQRLDEELGWDEDTIIIVVSDHGEEFGDHGQKGHQFTLYRELNQVVMIVRAPGVDPSRVAANVSLIDVLPTEVELAGLPRALTLERESAGHSLVPLMRFGAEAAADELYADRTLFAHRASIRRSKPLWAAIRGRWKLIENDVTGETMLFDLVDDPAETKDLSKERVDVVSRLHTELERFRITAPMESATGVQLEVDDELRSHLESLGYGGAEKD